MNDNFDLALNIKRIRELNNLTQEHVAKQVGISQSQYARLENGEIKTLKPDRVKKIAETLGVSAEQLKNFDKKAALRDINVHHNTDNHHNHIENQVVQQVANNLNSYQIDPKLEAVYEKQIKLLEELIDHLKVRIKELEAGRSQEGITLNLDS